MKRKWSYVLVFVLIAMLLAGCKAATSETNKSVAETSSQNEKEQEFDENAWEADRKTGDATAMQGEKKEQDNQDVSTNGDSKNPQVLLAQIHSYYEVIKDPENEYRPISVVEYPILTLGDAEKENYPLLSKSLEKAGTKQQSESRKILSENAEVFLEWEKMMEDSEDSEVYFTDEIRAKVLRADSNVFTAEMKYYGFSGGVHGYYCYSGESYDTKTGKKLGLTDVVKDTRQMFALVNEKLLADYPEVAFIDLEEYFEEVSVQDLCWSLGYEGILFYFNPYELASYADGMQTVMISFAEAPDLFEEKYKQVPDSYAFAINDEASVCLDVDGDGETESLSIQSRQIDDYGETTWVATLGDTSYSDSNAICFSHESYIVKMNQHYYLYVFETRENDYGYLNVVDLATMRRIDLGNANPNVRPHSSFMDEICRCEYAFTNPSDVLLESRIDVMSTYSGVKHYYIGENGIPYTEESMYQATFNGVLTTNEEIPCSVVDESGTVLEETVLPAGSLLRIARTNGDAIVDLMTVEESQIQLEKFDDIDWKYLKDPSLDLKSGKLYRIEIEKEDWEPMYNGKSALDLFDGIMFAG